MESMIRDIKLAPSGHDKIKWVKNFMPVMAAVDKEFSVSKPFAGKKMVITLHLEAKTAYMAEIFHHAGAEVAVTGSNPLSTQDDVAAALVRSTTTISTKRWKSSRTSSLTTVATSCIRCTRSAATCCRACSAARRRRRQA